MIEHQRKSNTAKKVIITLVAVVLILLLGVAIYFMYPYFIGGGSYQEGYDAGLEEGVVYTIYKMVESIEENGFVNINVGNQSITLIPQN